MRHHEAYAAGGDAHKRGEPAQPPATVPRQRKDAWLKGGRISRRSWSARPPGRSRTAASDYEAAVSQARPVLVPARIVTTHYR